MESGMECAGTARHGRSPKGMRAAASRSKHQNRKLIAVIALFALAFIVVAALPAMRAAKPDAAPKGAVAVQGDWIDCNTVTETKDKGDHQLITVAIAEKFTGALSGTYEGTEQNDVRPDGSGTFKGSGVFTGEITGRAGTAVMTYSGTLDKDGHAVAHWVLDQGTDALARIDGQGTFEGRQTEQRPDGCGNTESQSAFAGTYKGTVQFPPK